jgi:hypothetical protein
MFRARWVGNGPSLAKNPGAAISLLRLPSQNTIQSSSLSLYKRIALLLVSNHTFFISETLLVFVTAVLHFLIPKFVLVSLSYCNKNTTD